MLRRSCRRRARCPRAWLIGFGLAGGAVLGCGACSAGSVVPAGGSGGHEASTRPSVRTSSSAPAEASSTTLSLDIPDATPDLPDGAARNTCGTECGPVELCDEAHLGLDDNCNGVVDEGCACATGQVHFCFRGDPSYRGTKGCFDGVESCSELGLWGSCMGGVGAVPPDNCFLNDTAACHALSSPPFASVALRTGLGNFSDNAAPGTESFSVACPPGVSQCPAVSNTGTFKPIQSGQYTVTYTKQVASDGGPMSCSFPVFVGAPGLRIELSWEHRVADQGVDLDLHLHQPGNVMPWNETAAGRAEDCGWGNCVLQDFDPSNNPTAPIWFADPPATPPTPVNWWLDTTNEAANTCYGAPRGVGTRWKQLGKGCHNPRLDADNITCNFAITDPENPTFCNPENINVDFPPKSSYFRIGVHYFSNHGLNYDVHPEVKVYCNANLAADLGPHLYYSPELPVTFQPADGALSNDTSRFWLVADVSFNVDGCGKPFCNVVPLYADPTARTPLFTTADVVAQTFGPPYPPPP